MKREVYIAVRSERYYDSIGRSDMAFGLICVTFCQWFLPHPNREQQDWILYRCDKRMDRKRIRDHFERYGYETKTIVHNL